MVHIIVGLGNPGKEYEKTRHNVGFMVVDELARQHALDFKKGRGKYLETSLRFGNRKTYLIKPLTFMNLSGEAVAAAVRFYKLEDLSHLLVICDDLNLPFGTIRLRSGGSDGGQKGLRSVIQMLGTQDFPRLRIGIGNNFSNAVEYVLSPFSRKEQEDLPLIIKWAADAVRSFVADGIEVTMSRFNRNLFETN